MGKSKSSKRKTVKIQILVVLRVMPQVMMMKIYNFVLVEELSQLDIQSKGGKVYLNNRSHSPNPFILIKLKLENCRVKPRLARYVNSLR